MRTRRTLPPQVVLLGLVSLLNDAASEMIYPLLPIFLTATLGATPLLGGIIEGSADALASVLKLVAGMWSDRLRRRKPLIVAGYALATASRAMIGAASAWATVLSARLIDRTGKGIRTAPRDAMIADVIAPDQRGRAFGLHRALDHTGAVVGPLLALALLPWLTMRQMFFMAVIPGAIGLVLLIFFVRESSGAPVSSLARASGTTGPPLRVMVAIALFALANSTDAFLILQAHAAGVPVAMLPLLWAAHHVVKSVFSTQAGALSDRVGRPAVLATAWTIYAAIYLLFPFADSLMVFFALFVAYAIPFTLAEGTERALIADLVPPDSRGRGFGIYYLVNGLGVLGGSALFGLLYQRYTPLVAFGTGAALALAAAVAIVAFGRGPTPTVPSRR